MSMEVFKKYQQTCSMDISETYSMDISETYSMGISEPYSKTERKRAGVPRGNGAPTERSK
jgi:hypothetical protein